MVASQEGLSSMKFNVRRQSYRDSERVASPFTGLQRIRLPGIKQLAYCIVCIVLHSEKLIGNEYTNIRSWLK
jgi:hypothetical protein